MFQVDREQHDQRTGKGETDQQQGRRTEDDPMQREDGARQRLDAQWPTEKKAARAHFVITTDGTFEETDAQVEAVLKVLTCNL